jgi:murein DD-endopeptidase MepM/ murein hydrolase activator NlpD
MRSGVLGALLLPALWVLTGCSGGLRPAVAAAPAAAPPPPSPPASTLPPRPAAAGPLDLAVSDADLDALWARQLMVPVEGVLRRQLVDNYSAPRGARQHLALDIMAPRQTPVLAADDHIIGRLDRTPVGGIVIYATDPSGTFTYYYAHLHRYRRGLAVGDRVAKGSLIGYVGTTGNAPANAPHLHFQVMKRGAGRVWWDGPPINPHPFFAQDGTPP